MFSHLSSWKLLDGSQIQAKSLTQARMVAHQLGTKVLEDCTREELDQYKHRFGEHYKPQ